MENFGKQCKAIQEVGKMETKAPNRRRRKQYLNKQVYIPQVVQEEIILGLPVKSVVRFKSVCKAWLRMIQSSSFRDSYRRRHRHDYSNNLLYSPYSSSRKIFMKKSLSPLIDTIKLTPGPLDLRLPQKMTRLIRPDDHNNDEEKWRRMVRVMGPLSNGIYLVVNYYGKGDGISMVPCKLALCNPATHDYKFISTFPCHDDSDSSDFLPSDLGRKQCRVHYGFGIGSATTRDQNDYKVIVVIGWGPLFSSFLSFVYSLQRGTWRKIVDYELGKRHYRNRKATEGLFLEQQVRYPQITHDLELCPQRFFKGSWHWLAVHWMTVRADYAYTIMLFDFADDSFKLMDTPPFYKNAHYHLTTSSVSGSGLFVLNDHLCAIFCTRPCYIIEVWMMDEYGVPESWKKIHAIKLNFITEVRRLVGISSRGDHRGGGGGGYGIETIFFHDYRNLLISYDASGCYKEHGRFDISSGIWWNTLGISSYMETLEPF